MTTRQKIEAMLAVNGAWKMAAETDDRNVAVWASKLPGVSSVRLWRRKSEDEEVWSVTFFPVPVDEGERARTPGLLDTLRRLEEGTVVEESGAAEVVGAINWALESLPNDFAEWWGVYLPHEFDAALDSWIEIQALLGIKGRLP